MYQHCSFLLQSLFTMHATHTHDSSVLAKPHAMRLHQACSNQWLRASISDSANHTCTERANTHSRQRFADTRGK